MIAEGHETLNSYVLTFCEINKDRTKMFPKCFVIKGQGHEIEMLFHKAFDFTVHRLVTVSRST